ncbi:MAG: hypothetical protein IPO26_15180 [Saprospiraceae bacterium]|nr:hypothetical protein [Saprospiraceae bacterium]
MLFYWQGSSEVATLVDDIEDERVRFKWDEADDDEEYLEFRMYKSDVTNETIFEITDFVIMMKCRKSKTYGQP